MSNGNLCIIKLKPFWLPQLPVTLEQALSYKNKIGQCYFCNSDNKYGVTTYLNFLSIGTFYSNKLEPFWLSELLVILDNKFEATKTKAGLEFQFFLQRLNISYLILTEIILTAWFRLPTFDNGLRSFKILVRSWPHYHTHSDMLASNRKLSTSWPTCHWCAKLHH